MQTIKFVATNEDDTMVLGAAIANCLSAGVNIGLTGTLGAGKTRLVQAISAALGVDQKQVVSPTFSLVHLYAGGRLPLIHIDTYRIKDGDEFMEIGVEEYLESNAVVLIEWAERFADWLPPDLMWIRIVLSESKRTFEISSSDSAPGFFDCLSAAINKLA